MDVDCMETMSVSFGPKVSLPHARLHDAFESIAKRSPELEAIETDGTVLTYGELNSAASTLACDLAAHGMVVETRVAVIMDRRVKFIIGLLATQLEPRTVHEVAQRETPVLTVSYQLLGDDTKEVVPSSEHVASPANEAYIVYMSGSTGTPKGVPVLHMSAANAIVCRAEEIGFTPDTQVMQFMAIGFDVCQWEVWSALSHGSTLVLRSEADLEGLTSVDILTITPTGLSLLGEPPSTPD
ncbi:hypothetical protein H310_10655 [Aphanomyces invadans]|uniref:AMP-dependent synthetase/ligase domain-containing protein n=1 Tax=Aphanomyces invadans TaxID=157072 RepID=A0A024TPD3_9STRA|nr:hypothetical protein H310_10655 [Aphanomyces invadans]ETV96000.1 hypothetical protein H310_10655 [Aphanomyces invadans]|eukprot:XP_008875311.1 hypothetical protein H310_10655 [Aphanomyces invadans]